ncbi:MAG: carbon-nitrogen hydrolase family protein [Polyangiaceae bacterium]
MSDEPVLRVGAVQMSCQDDLSGNLRKAREGIARCAARGARLILLPENLAYMGTEEDKRAIAEDLDGEGPIVKLLSEAARSEGVWVIGGGIPERSADPDRPFNTSVAFAPSGERAARYRKIHLFDVDIADGASYRESRSTSPGETVEDVVVDGFRVRLSVCYDLRFPELYRRGPAPDLVTLPAAFTLLTGKDHWHVLLRARAIENQVYVLAAAQWGLHPKGKRTYGKSCVVDPWGDIVAQATEGEGIVLADVERRRIDEVRAQLPCLEHRRL